MDKDPSQKSTSAPNCFLEVFIFTNIIVSMVNLLLCAHKISSCEHVYEIP
jgi:hypothetical protein